MEVPGGKFLVTVLLTSFLSCFPAYYFAVINVAEAVYRDFINQTFTHTYGKSLSGREETTVFAFMVTAYNVGGIVGSLGVAVLAERWGRRLSLMLLNNLGVLVAAALMAFAHAALSFAMLVLGRLVAGVCTSLAYGLLTLYLTEVGPTRYRGFSASCLNLMLSLNTLMTLVLALPQALGTTELWIPLNGLAAPFALLQILLLPLFPETPKHLLLKKKDRAAAKKSYRFFDPSATRADLRAAFKHFENENKIASNQATLIEVLRTRYIRSPILVGIACNVACLTTGIVVIFSYSTGLFQNIGLDKSTAQYSSLLMSGCNTLGAVLANFLMDRVGRRPLMLWGLGTTSACLLLFMIFSLLPTSSLWPSYLSIAVILIHVTVYNIGPGAIAWFIASEMTTQSARSISTSIILVCVGITAVATNFAFPPVQELIGPYAFLTLLLPSLLLLLLLHRFLPETKNTPVDEIVAHWRRHSPHTLPDTAF